MDGGVVAIHTYLHANESGVPFAIEADSFRPWVTENLSSGARAKFEAAVQNGVVRLDALEDAGFTLAYDEAEAVLRIAVTPDALATSTLSLAYEPVALNQVPMKNAGLSGFVNFRGGQDYVHESLSVEGRQPARADIDGAVNAKGWVLEGRTEYLEGSDRPWMRDDVRLVHDWPDAMVRGAFGDLSYPVSWFQGYQPMAGISLARNFSLQPYRVTEPNGRTSFTLASPSRVDVIVNGQRVRTLQLEPGPYDVSDFPVSEGTNDIELVITDVTGNVERKIFPLISNQRLLKAGLHEYAYNAGVQSEKIDRRIDYEDDEPVFSGFHRYGFTDEFTGGVSLQGGGDIQQFGLSFVSAFDWGTMGVESAASHGHDGMDGASIATYEFVDTQTHKNFALSAEYRGADFTALGQDEPVNPVALELSGRYMQPIFYDITMGVGGRYGFSRGDQSNPWSYSANFSKVLYGAISANMTFQHRSQDGAGIFMGVTWTPYEGDHMVSASADTLSNTQETNWNWRDGRRWQAGAGVARQDETIRKTGNASYSGYRGEASVYHDVTTSISEMGGGTRNISDRRTNLRVGTAIAFANDHIALSRPINSGFIILTRHDNLKGRSIGVNPEGNDENTRGQYQARIDGLGPAVIPDAVPYMYRPVRVDTTNLPDTYDIGADNFVAMPSYKRGAVVTIGSSANIYADGFLVSADGAPVALQGGVIQKQGSEALEFFTNQKGRFRISRLEPGEYTITLNDQPGAPAKLKIPEIGAGKFEAGTITMGGKS